MDGTTLIVHDNHQFDIPTSPSSLVLRRVLGVTRNETIKLDESYQIVSSHLLVVLLETKLVANSKQKKSTVVRTLNIIVPRNYTLAMLLRLADAALGCILNTGNDPIVSSVAAAKRRFC